MSQENNEIRSFTGLRGLTAVFVMAFHFRIFNFLQGPVKSFAEHGYLCVDIFFILSGYVMAMTYQSLFAHGFDRQSFYKFTGRRIARIYPLYLFVTLFSFALLILFPDTGPQKPLTAGRILLNLSMVQAWGFAESYVGPAWSISTEFAAYLIFPVLIVLTVFSFRWVSIIALTASTISLILLASLPAESIGIERIRGPLDLSKGTDYGPITRCLLEFTIGLLTYRFYKSDLGEKIAGYKFLSLLVTVSIIILLAIPDSDIFVVLLIPILLLSIANDDTPVAKFLGWRPIHWLGVISYSLYLVHALTFWISQPIKSIILENGWPYPNIIPVICQFIIAFTGAVLTYYLIEKPGRKVLRYWFEPKKNVRDEGNPNLSAP